MQHIVIETIEAYEYFKEKNNKIIATYYSSNEELILYLKSKKEKVINIEIFLTKEEVNKIGKLSFKIQSAISDYLNKKCEFLDNINVGSILNFSIFQSFLY